MPLFRPDGSTLSAYLNSTAEVSLIMGPVGSGKSACCVARSVMRMQRQKPSRDGKRRTRGLVIRRTNGELKTTTIPTWHRWVPASPHPDSWGVAHRTVPYTHFIRHGDIETDVIFMGLEDLDVDKIRSFELTWAWINEGREIDKAVVDAVHERIKRYPPILDLQNPDRSPSDAAPGGATDPGICIDTNAPPEDHWWAYMSGDVPPPDHMSDEDKLTLIKPSTWRFHRQPPAMLEVHEGTGKAKRLVGYRPNPAAENTRFLDPTYYPKLIEGKPRRFIKIQVLNEYGEHEDTIGIFTGEWNEELHLAKAPIAVNRHVPVRWGIDFGLKIGVVFTQTVDGQVRVIAELFTQRIKLALFASQVLLPFMHNHFRGCEMEAGTGDPAGSGGTMNDPESAFAILRGAGVLAFPAVTNAFDLRVNVISKLLTSMTAEGRPRLLVDPRCKMFERGLAGGYKRRLIKVPYASPIPEEKPIKNDVSHVVEAGQYAFLGSGEGSALTRPTRGQQAVVAQSDWSPTAGSWGP